MRPFGAHLRSASGAVQASIRPSWLFGQAFGSAIGVWPASRERGLVRQDLLRQDLFRQDLFRQDLVLTLEAPLIH